MSGKSQFSIEQYLLNAWYGKNCWLIFLRPFSWLFQSLAYCRRMVLQSRYQGRTFACPLIVIGNISVGGSGKTPFTIALAKALIQRGYRVGIVSRGYAGKAHCYPLSVTSETAVEASGDEPLLMARELAGANCPVVVDPNRVAAVNNLLANHSCDVVLADDGLQHYRLHRDVEIAVVDLARGVGNGCVLPAGPLREPVGRLSEVDFVVANGGGVWSSDRAIDAQFSIKPVLFRNIASGHSVSVDSWSESRLVHAVAAIGNPQRFADTLQSLGFEVRLHPGDDHRPLKQVDLSFADELPVIITAKDAVKYADRRLHNVWVLEVEASVAPAFVSRIIQRANLPIKTDS